MSDFNICETLISTYIDIKIILIYFEDYLRNIFDVYYIYYEKR
jgi:hypothetical protein